jgi:plastocyanin
MNALETVTPWAAVLLPLMACTTPSPAFARVIKVRIVEMAFIPQNVSVKGGDTVEWTNGDFVDHTATANDNRWDVLIKAGQSAQHKFMQLGSMKYFCKIHPDMAGIIIVIP